MREDLLFHYGVFTQSGPKGVIEEFFLKNISREKAVIQERFAYVAGNRRAQRRGWQSRTMRLLGPLCTIFLLNHFELFKTWPSFKRFDITI